MLGNDVVADITGGSVNLQISEKKLVVAGPKHNKQGVYGGHKQIAGQCRKGGQEWAQYRHLRRLITGGFPPPEHASGEQIKETNPPDGSEGGVNSKENVRA